MKRYRIRLGYPRGRTQHEYVYAADAKVYEGYLILHDDKGTEVAIYKPGQWTICRVVGQR
jgi:hypothetical protein